jgi:hypothetical protein
MAEGSDFELRRNKRLNLFVSQSFSIYICRVIYHSKGRDYNTRIMPIIFPIYTFYNMNMNLFLHNLVSYKVIIHLNMFTTSMENKIR